MDNKELKKKIHDYLLKVGIKPHNSGFTYLSDAIEMMIEKNMLKPKMYSVIYQKIASKYSMHWSRVERCIRYVIKKANDEVKSMKPGHFVAMAVLEVK